jgi:hypothetical protein
LRQTRLVIIVKPQKKEENFMGFLNNLHEYENWLIDRQDETRNGLEAWHERDEKTKEMVEQLGEYEQEIYEKDRLILDLQNEIDLHKEIVEKWQVIQIPSIT